MVSKIEREKSCFSSITRLIFLRNKKALFSLEKNNVSGYRDHPFNKTTLLRYVTKTSIIEAAACKATFT